MGLALERWRQRALGQVTTYSGFPLSAFFLAVSAAGMFLLAALAVVGIWVSFGWWRVLAIGGAILSLLLMAGLFGATKLLPMVLDLVVVCAAITNWPQPWLQPTA
jgi:hypothetical protein